MEKLFARKNDSGNYDIFHECGENATRINANIYPIGSSLSTRYEHPGGIVLTAEQVDSLGIEIEE